MLDPAENDGDAVGDLRQQLRAPAGELGLVEILGGDGRGQQEEDEENQPASGGASVWGWDGHL